MISFPAPGLQVRIHYRATVAPHMPHHGRTGRVVLAARSRPRNHAVRLDVAAYGDADTDAARKECDRPLIVVVPAGNLQREGGGSHTGRLAPARARGQAAEDARK